MKKLFICLFFKFILTYFLIISFLYFANSAFSASPLENVVAGTGFALTILGILIGSGIYLGLGLVSLKGWGTVGSYFFTSFCSVLSVVT